MTNVGIYLRISEDRDGNQTATDRQRADCARFADAHDFQVADIFEDVDLSAYKKGTRRPEFERMLQAIKDKQIHGVLAWKIDRITRRQRDLVRLDEACDEAGGFIATVVENIDTRQPTGRFIAELLVAQARMESENSSIRVARKHEERAASGKPNTGGSRMFGYSMDRMTVIPDEAELVHELVQRVLAGESLRGICFDWGRRSITTTTGRPWKQTAMGKFLSSAAASGQREYRGVLTKGTWPAIITADEHRRVRLLIGDGARRTSVIGRKYLLSGYLRCGLCSAPLIAHPAAGGVRRYGCRRRPGSNSCGKLARLAEPIEDLVREAILVALDGVDLREYIHEPNGAKTDGLLELIRGDEEALEQLSRDHYADKRIGRAEYFAARDAINARLEANRRRLTQSNGHGLLNKVIGAGEEVRRQWSEQGLDWQRAVVGAVIDHIVLEPAVKGRNFFDPSLVRVVWKF